MTSNFSLAARSQPVDLRISGAVHSGPVVTTTYGLSGEQGRITRTGERQLLSRFSTPVRASRLASSPVNTDCSRRWSGCAAPYGVDSADTDPERNVRLVQKSAAP